MPLHDRDLRVLIRAALLGISSAVLVAVGPVPVAMADDPEGDAADTGFGVISNVLSTFGLQSADRRPNIDYRERSPLVVPPKIELPPPEAPGAATKNPRWPNDPDEKRRREIAAARKNTVFDSAIDDSRRLSPAELNRGRVAGANARAIQRKNENVDETVLSPAELTKNAKKSGFWSMFSSEPDVAAFEGEPPRTSLTEPPPGYRTPAPSQVYGVGPAAAQAYDLSNKKGTEE